MRASTIAVPASARDNRAVKHLGLRAWPVALLAATLVIEAGAVALSWRLEPGWDTVVYAIYAVTQVAVGALIVSRHPRHRIGWLFIVDGIVTAVAADLAQGWGLRAAEQGWPGGLGAEWIALSSWIVTAPLGVLLFLWFPDGHLTRRGWQVLAWASVIGAAIALAGWAMDPDLGDQFIGGRNPFAVESAPIDLLLGVGMPLFLGSLVVAIVPLVQRYRRSVGVERLQLRWFSFACVCAAVVLPTVALLWSVVPAVRPLTALALTAIPVAAGIAILRYRLYDIDLVISRTLTYTVLTMLLAGTYTVAVVVLGAAVGRGSAWATAGATLAVAAAFGPLRRRLQDAVDRRFDRARFDALHQMSLFLDDLRAGRAAPEDVERVLRSALGVEDLHVHLVLPGSSTAVDLHGTPVAEDPDDGRSRSPIRRGATVIGTVVGPADLAERGSLVPKLLDAGALAVEVARLRVELRRQLEEVEASRARIVAAADHERHRIERDLHDGAQQRLVSIGLALRHAQHALGTGVNPDVSRTLDDAVAEITVAIDELRQLAGGLRPAPLDAGLGPALRDLARRAPLPVEVDAASDRFPTHIETAAYFCVCEGLTNAVKHAHATRIQLTARRDRDRLVVTVDDDGVGGAATHNGSGLTGLTDRVAAHGGTLTIDSHEGRGTTLVAEFPCAS